MSTETAVKCMRMAALCLWWIAIIQEIKIGNSKKSRDRQEEEECMEKAACLGVYLHACAGDAAAKEAGNGGITASDIIRGLGFLL